MLEACPLPCLVLDAERQIRQLNRAFALWLNLDPRATVGQRLDNIMILRGQNLKEMWTGLADGRLPRGAFNATYVSPGKVRTSQATALALANGGAAAALRRARVAWSCSRPWPGAAEPSAAAARASGPRRALGQDPLQRAAMHAEPPRGLRDVAIALLEHPLDVLPAHPVGRHRPLGRLLRLLALGPAAWPPPAPPGPAWRDSRRPRP